MGIGENKMPGQDRTGPMGQGPMTGRGLGPCGRGLGFRRGFGRRFGRVAMQPVEITQPVLTEIDEKKILEEELKEIENEKKEIQNRLKELK